MADISIKVSHDHIMIDKAEFGIQGCDKTLLTNHSHKNLSSYWFHSVHITEDSMQQVASLSIKEGGIK